MKINLHTHTNYSDGYATMREYVNLAKEQNHVALVITDHDYMLKRSKISTICITTDEDTHIKQQQFIDQILEASTITREEGFPVIVGLEISLGVEEALLFGQLACIDWFNYRKEINNNIYKDDKLLRNFLIKHEHAIVLCHPYDISYADTNLMSFWDIFHGYEVKNCIKTWNTSELNILKALMPNAKQYKNFDSHHLDHFNGECNSVNSYIGNEMELIQFIKGVK